MKQSTLLKTSAEIAVCLEDQKDLPEPLVESLEVSQGLLHMLIFSDSMASDKETKEVMKQAPKKKSTPKKTKKDEVLGASEDEAFELLKDESKPGPTLLKKTFNIATEAAVALFKAVEPRIVEYKETQTKKEPKKGKKQDIKKVIAGLPKGSNLLVKAPFNLIAKLDEKYHAPYLAGLKLEDMISSDNLAAAAEEGYDDTLVKHIIKYADKKRPTPKKVVDATQYQDKIIEWTNAIPDGGDLFNHMSSAGLSKTVLANFRDIATAVSE